MWHNRITSKASKQASKATNKGGAMILYRGPSQLDGAPIVAIATIGSRNRKTGDMVQVWVLREDISPLEAIRLKLDRSVCGDCKHRRSKDGACYVDVSKAPTSVWKRFKRGGYDDAANIRQVTSAMRTTPIRLGAYGDPAAVPDYVWEALIAEGCHRWTGYTHQWKRGKFQALKGLVMASADSEAEAQQAHAMGWRYFLVQPRLNLNIPHAGKLVQCASDASGTTCRDCGACDGTRAGSRSATAASIAIEVHGAMKSKFKLPVIRA